jgi:hypothetical protein
MILPASFDAYLLAEVVQIPVPHQPCPTCEKPTPRKLDGPSDFATVNYYRCEGCGHVWTTSKKDGSIVTHVTPLTKAPKNRLARRDAGLVKAVRLKNP